MEREAGRGDSEDRPDRGGPPSRPTGLAQHGPPAGPQPPLNGRHPGSARVGGPPEPGPPDDPDEPVWVKHRPPFYYQPRVIMAVLVVVVVIGGIALGKRAPRYPPTPNCDTPVVRTSASHVRKGYLLYWAATGGPGRYAVTLGASGVRVTGGRVAITGTEPRAGDEATVVRQPAKLTGCRWLGHLRMPLGSGQYSLRLYRIDGGEATQVGRTRVDSDG